MIRKTITLCILLVLITGTTGVLGQNVDSPENLTPIGEKSFILLDPHGDQVHSSPVYRISEVQGMSQNTTLRQEYILTTLEENRSEGSREFRPWMGSENPPGSERSDDPLSPLLRLFISTGMMVALLILAGCAGLRIGSSYRYECCEKTQKLITVGHVISSLLIAFPIWIIYTIQTDTADQYFLATMYALFGVLIYLMLSSLVQALSILKNRPVPPVYHIHILFVFIAISLILMGRVPFFPPLPNTILAISVMFLPGAVLSLLTGQIIRRLSLSADLDPGITLTHPQSVIRAEITSSFPDSLQTKYQDISIIGSGGVAVVYRAVRVKDGRQVALKIPFSPDESSGRTFLNEMAIWRDLHHPCIVEVYDQNIFPVPYVEMEYLGRSLRDITYPVSADRAYSIIRDISSALALSLIHI